MRIQSRASSIMLVTCITRGPARAWIRQLQIAGPNSPLARRPTRVRDPTATHPLDCWLAYTRTAGLEQVVYPVTLSTPSPGGSPLGECHQGPSAQQWMGKMKQEE